MAQAFGNAFVKSTKFLYRVGITQRKHAVGVRDGLKFFGDRTAHTLARAIGIKEVRKLVFQGHQFG